MDPNLGCDDREFSINVVNVRKQVFIDDEISPYFINLIIVWIHKIFTVGQKINNISILSIGSFQGHQKIQVIKFF